MTEILKNVAVIKKIHMEVYTHRVLLTDRGFSLLCGIKLEVLFAKGNILHSRLAKAQCLVPWGAFV